jgi:fibronectin type 3 domain-containing protein
MKKTTPGAALVAALLMALVAVSCDRDRSNPLDPQSDFVRNRPDAPAQLAVEPGVGVIRIAWQGVADLDLAGYALFRSERSNGTFSFVVGDGDSTAGITTGKTTFADSIRSENRTFFYRVAAVDTAGLQSELTAFVGATALEDNVSPESPQSLSAVPDEDVLGRVVLRWSAPQNDSDGRDLSGLAGYVVLRAEAGLGGVVPVDTLLAGLREFADDGLKTLTTYSYSMVAFDAVGNSSRPATAVQVTTPGLSTPTSVSAADEIGRIVVTWSPVDDEALIGYDVFRSTNSDDGYDRLAGTEGAAFTTGRTSYIDSNLTGNLNFYRVRAVGRVGVFSEFSTFVSAEARADESAPGSPRNVSAVADERDLGRITVGWSAPSTDLGGGDLTGLDGYVLLRAKSTEGAFLPVDTLASDIRTFVDTGLKALTGYRYAVVAFDASGNQSSQGLSGLTSTPGILEPKGLAAHDEIGRIVVTWQPVDDSNLAGYDVYRSTQSNDGYLRLGGGEGGSFTTGFTVYIDSNLAGGSLFFYKVQAVGTNGLQSERSSFVGGRALADEAAPGAPRNVSAVADENDPNKITVGWSAPSTDADGGTLTGLDGYVLLRAEGTDGALVPVDTLSAETRTYADTGLKALTTYRYALIGVDASGNQSLQALSSSPRTAGIPAPVGLAAKDEIGRIVVTWQLVDYSNLAGYDVYRSTQSNDGYLRLQGGEGGSFTTGLTAYIDSNLAGGSLFFYKVQAVGTNGLQSERSSFVGGQALADESAPGAPRNVSAVADEDDPGQITVGWSAPDVDAGGGVLTGLAGFVLLRAEGTDGAFLLVDSLNAELRTFVDTGLKALTNYRYALFGFDESSNQSTQALSNVTRTAGIRSPTGLSSQDEIGRIVVTWQPVDDANLAGYDVYRSTRSDSGYVRIDGSEGRTFTTGRTSFTDSNLVGGSLFFYKVQSLAITGLQSELSTFVSGRALDDEAAPGSPRNVSAVADENDPGQITVGWSAPAVDADGGDLTGLDGFLLLRAEGAERALLPVDTLNAELSTYVDRGLKALTTYRYAMVAFDASGNQSPQAPSNSTRTAGIPTPAQLRVTNGLGHITLQWQAVDSDALLGYEIHRASGSDGTYEILTGNEGSSFTTGRTSYIDSNLAGGSLLFYKVRAVGANGLTSELSSFVSGTAAAAAADESAPGAPQNVSVIPSDTDPTQMSVRWTAPITDSGGGTRTGLDGFRLLRAEGSGSLVPVATLAVDARQYNDSGLRSLTVYRYSLIAFDAAGNESAQSSTSQAQTIGVSVPSGLRASDGIGRIQLSWNAVDDDDLIGYNVYRSTRPDLTFALLAGDGSEAFTTGRTAYVDSTVTAVELLYYRVSAVTASLQSERSDFVSGRAGIDDVAPASPSDVVAIADEAQALVSLSWYGSSVDQGGSDLTGLTNYIVFRGKDSSTALVALDTIDASSTAYADSALQAATTYYYAVSALDGSGNVSPRSSAVSVVTQGIWSPANVSASGDVKSITVSWSASSEDDLLGYNVYRSSRSDEDFSRLAGAEGASFTTGQTSFIDSNLSGGQILFYRISVVTATGESERSAFDGATVQTDTRAPAAPTFLDGEPITGDPERLTLSWRAPGSDSNGSTLTGVSLYRIYRATTSDGDYQEIATSTTTSYDDTGLEQRTTYFYQVEALDDDGNISPRSSTAAVTTSGVDLPANVRLVSSTPSDVAAKPIVTASWTKSVGAIVRYEVERTTIAGSVTDSDFTAVTPNNVNTTRSDDSVVRGTTYYYRVRAVDIDGRESDWTELLAITVSN